MFPTEDEQELGLPLLLYLLQVSLHSASGIPDPGSQTYSALVIWVTSSSWNWQNHKGVPGGRASPSGPRTLNYVNYVDWPWLSALRFWGPLVAAIWLPPVNMTPTKSRKERTRHA